VQGTEIRFVVRNLLAERFTFFVPASTHGGADALDAMDSVVVMPGAVGSLTIRATTPGNYVYRAMTSSRSSAQMEMTGALAGGLVIDSATRRDRAHDRVFVIMQTPDSAWISYADTAKAFALVAPPVGRFIFTINGESWPNTNRIAATVGDSLHWRIINASPDVHPMHLHGFYYRVDAFTAPAANRFGKPPLGEMVVTQLMSPLSGMSMTWSPDRPGNWIFHCHFALHLEPDSISGAPDDPHLRDMVGLVLGINVADRSSARPAVDRAGRTPVRHLRLVAISDTTIAHGAIRRGSVFDTMPSMYFSLEERGRLVKLGSDLSPELDLTRGEPVAIMVVNHLSEPTSVHWHGIEIQDSYMDGVAGFSGAGRRLAPEIAPRDSFEVRFTPPRSGTFMYHAHVDEVREQLAGLEGALIVRDPGRAPSVDDHAFFLKGLPSNRAHPLEINGQVNADTLILHVGQPARLRFLSLATVNIAPMLSLTARPDSALLGVRDTMVVRWRLIAKDGADLPSAAQHPILARQILGVGETYDFEYRPLHTGTLRLEIRTNGGQHNLLTQVPIRVE
jgi:FtsP/CotA-like multicopper oxidase with cupredoxin domain